MLALGSSSCDASKSVNDRNKRCGRTDRTKSNTCITSLTRDNLGHRNHRDIRKDPSYISGARHARSTTTAHAMGSYYQASAHSCEYRPTSYYGTPISMFAGCANTCRGPLRAQATTFRHLHAQGARLTAAAQGRRARASRAADAPSARRGIFGRQPAPAPPPPPSATIARGARAGRPLGPLGRACVRGCGGLGGDGVGWSGRMRTNAD